MKLFLHLIITSTLLLADYLAAQEIPASKKTKGTFYFSWGYNRDWFSKSDIHFKNTSSEFNPLTRVSESYDFTVYDVEARDRSGLRDILRTDITIPQYNYRFGYYFNDKKDLGIEINFDHVKYVVKDWQTLHIKGTIHGQAIDKDTLISPDFLQFEHTDGANFLFLNFIKRHRLLESHNKKHSLSVIGKIGAGIVIPRTQVTLFGETINNCFHIAGYGGGLEGGFRYAAFKNIFLEYTVKTSFTNYTNVLVIGTGKANHYFFTGENILTFGFQFSL